MSRNVEDGTGTLVPSSLKLATVLALGVGLAIAAPSAGAHAVVLPGASRPADFQQYTLTVPTERDVPTVEVDLKIPEGIGFLLVQRTSGWQVKVIKRNERIDEIRWTGGEIPHDFFATFKLIARNPVQQGDIAWRVIQRYKGGEVVRWIGEPDSAQPASRTRISEDAVPVDTLDVVSGRTAAAAPSPSSSGSAKTTETSSGDDGRDGLTLGLALFAALAAVCALGLGLLAWRRPQRSGGESPAG